MIWNLKSHSRIILSYIGVSRGSCMVGTAQSGEAAEGTQSSFVVWVCFGRGMGRMCACVCERESAHVCLGVSHACEWGITRVLELARCCQWLQYLWTESPTPQQHQNTALQCPKNICYLRSFRVFWLVFWLVIFPTADPTFQVKRWCF